jgi:glycosyltransferase involved in cell wall biosynthesis
MAQHGSGTALPPGVSVVVPVFRSTATLQPLLERVQSAVGDRPYELVFVDDGSPPATWEVLRELARRPGVTAVRLGRNAGQHAALLAGVRRARYATVVTLDDDLQNPPEMIPRLLDALETQGADVIYGWSPDTGHAWWRRAGSATIRRTISTALRTPEAARMGAFRAFRTSLRDGFASELGPGVSLDALLSWSTDRFGVVEVEHHQRAEGRSGYQLGRLLRFAVDMLTGYSTLPLRAVTLLGLLTSTFGLGVLAYVLVRYAIAGTSVAGFPFLASLIAIFSGAQMLSLGIIGEYLGRMHLRLQRRPTYAVAEVLQAGPPRTGGPERRGADTRSPAEPSPRTGRSYPVEPEVPGTPSRRP